MKRYAMIMELWNLGKLLHNTFINTILLYSAIEVIHQKRFEGKQHEKYQRVLCMISCWDKAHYHTKVYVKYGKQNAGKIYIEFQSRKMGLKCILLVFDGSNE
jgi:hypothetical protein